MSVDISRLLEDCDACGHAVEGSESQQFSVLGREDVAGLGLCHGVWFKNQNLG